MINVSKSQQQLEVVVDGVATYRWPISSGRPGFATPSGTYRPIRLERQWYSHRYNMTPMPYSVFFHRGYAVHGTMESRNLGRAVSHGCVRLRPDNAAVLFSLVRRHGAGNTKVVVMNGPLPGAPRVPPQGMPVAEAEKAPRPPANASVGRDQERPGGRPGARARVTRNERFSFARGDEARVLRAREAWLRSLDRKYGIAH